MDPKTIPSVVTRLDSEIRHQTANLERLNRDLQTTEQRLSAAQLDIKERVFYALTEQAETFRRDLDKMHFSLSESHERLESALHSIRDTDLREIVATISKKSSKSDLSTIRSEITKLSDRVKEQETFQIKMTTVSTILAIAFPIFLKLGLDKLAG